MNRNVKKLESGKKENLDVVVAYTDPDEGDGYLLPLKKIYEELLNRKANIEEQMTQISQSLSGMEGLMEMAKARGFYEEQNMSVSEQAGLALAVVVRQQNEEEVSEQEEEGEEEEEKGGGDKAGGRRTREDKAEKIQRLRSGFKICRPHGTFLWPNNGNTCNYSPNQFHHHGIVVVPTPPSASSSTTHPHRHHLFPASPTTPQLAPAGTHPTSPVKPLARRPGPGPVSSSTATTTTTAFSAAELESCSTLLNLNEAPPLPQSLHQISDAEISVTHTYQRKHQNTLSYSQNEVPHLVEGNSDNEGGEEEREKARKLSSVSSSAASSSTPSLLAMKEGEGLWLDLDKRA